VSTTVVDETPVVGRTGTLTIGTRGGEGAGEVLIKLEFGSQTFLAWSDDPLPKGQAVLVVGSRGGRTVDVVAWSGHLPVA
jgi:hypothetical protein